MDQQATLVINMTLNAWHTQIKWVDNIFNALSDEQLQNEVAPGRNSGVYLLGHLTAVHDRMLPLLGFEQQIYPQLDDIFLSSPDKSGKEVPAISDLRNFWNTVNTALANHFSNLTPAEWLEKHAAVSAEDFIKEPHRNRLNVMISRTNHVASHYGQLLFLKK